MSTLGAHPAALVFTSAPRPSWLFDYPGRRLEPEHPGQVEIQLGPQVCQQTRQVQPISVMICNAGTRTCSPAESRL